MDAATFPINSLRTGLQARESISAGFQAHGSLKAGQTYKCVAASHVRAGENGDSVPQTATSIPEAQLPEDGEGAQASATAGPAFGFDTWELQTGDKALRGALAAAIISQKGRKSGDVATPNQDNFFCLSAKLPPAEEGAEPETMSTYSSFARRAVMMLLCLPPIGARDRRRRHEVRNC